VATSGNSKLSIPTFIPLAEATRKYDLTEDVLTRLIQDGRIDAAQLPSGELLVSDKDLDQARTKEEIIKEKFGHLQGKPIRISQASRKYNVPNSTIRDYIDCGYIGIVDEGYPKKIDEADAAYCAEIYHERKELGVRAPLLDENGLPYQLKRPELSEYRRQRRNRVN